MSGSSDMPMDIVGRLRQQSKIENEQWSGKTFASKAMLEAADHIERLEARELELLRKLETEVNKRTSVKSEER